MKALFFFLNFAIFIVGILVLVEAIQLTVIGSGLILIAAGLGNFLYWQFKK